VAAAGLALAAVAALAAAGVGHWRQPPARSPAAAAPGPSPTPRPGGPAAGAPLPSGWPGPGSTGVPAGVPLTIHPGDLVTTHDRQVIDAVDVRGGGIVVRHSGVTVRRTRVTANPAANGPTGISVLGGLRDVTVQDCEIDMRNAPGGTGIGYEGLLVRRCDIHGAEKGIQIGDHVTALDNWVHDPYTGAAAHTEAVAVFGSGTPVRSLVRHNTLSNPRSQTAVVFIKTDQGPVDGVTVDGNYLDGGNYTVYSVVGDYDRVTPPRGVAVTNNVFTRAWVYGATSFDGAVIFTGNTYPDRTTVR
jgi:hypothetical protein